MILCTCHELVLVSISGVQEWLRAVLLGAPLTLVPMGLFIRQTCLSHLFHLQQAGYTLLTDSLDVPFMVSRSPACLSSCKHEPYYLLCVHACMHACIIFNVVM